MSAPAADHGQPDPAELAKALVDAMLRNNPGRFDPGNLKINVCHLTPAAADFGAPLPPAPPLVSAEKLLRRLSARGDWRITPRDHRELTLTWWPRGQGPGYSSHTGNPFCQRNWHGTSLLQIAAAAVDDTTPRRADIEDAAACRRAVEETRETQS